ncbi:MAG: type II secretion system protein GspM [Nitrospinota bacterium]
MKITEKSKRGVIFGGILILLIILYIMILEPLMKYERRMREDIALKEALLNRHKTILEGRADVEARSRRARKLIEKAKNRIFFAKTQALAAAQLQSVIQNIAKKYDVTIKSMNIKKPVVSEARLTEKTEGYNTISLQFVTYSSIRGLVDFLYELETEPRFINITSFTIKGEIIREASRLDSTFVVGALAEVES